MKRKLRGLGVMVVATAAVAGTTYLILGHVSWAGISAGIGCWLALIFLTDQDRPDQNLGSDGER